MSNCYYVVIKAKGILLMLVCASILFEQGVGSLAAQATLIPEGPKQHFFDAATIKPVNPNVSSHVGFEGRPGGKIAIGDMTLKSLICYAFDVQDFQVAGGPVWLDQNLYDIVAVAAPPVNDKQAQALGFRSTPTEIEREMLLNLLIERFGLKFHSQVKFGPVYFLTRGNRKLYLSEANNKTLDPRGGVLQKGEDIWDGEAFGRNVTMEFLARQLSSDLDRPVVDKTELKGSYDFHVPPLDPENRDALWAVKSSMQQIGLELRSGRGPVAQIIIDAATKPSDN